MQEHPTEEVNLYLKIQIFQQQNVEKLSLILFDMIHTIIKHLITQRYLKYFPVAERLKHFHTNLEKLTSDPFILDLVQGYQIAFVKTCPKLCNSDGSMNQKEVLLIKRFGEC